MKITLSVIKADIGSIGGHIRPSDELLAAVEKHIKQKGKDLIIDFRISHAGDDIAILSTHKYGALSPKVHRLCWDAFITGTEVAKKQGLYGAGQDLLKESFSKNVKGMGPAVAEIELEERKAEPFLFFAADKTDAGAYSLPLYLSFGDPMHCAGLILSPTIKKGFKFVIMDVSCTEADRVIELQTPEELYNIAALLRDQNRFVVESVWSKETGEQVASCSTTRLHNIAGKYVGKDDPVLLVRTQYNFPATGEILSPYVLTPSVSGFMRGSHTGPLMPVKMNSQISFFDGPPIVSAMAFSVRNGKLTGPADAFDQPLWDHVRDQVSEEAIELRRQGFFGPAMLPEKELEYGGLVETLQELDKKFTLRKKE